MSLSSLKGPTCVLINPDGKTLKAFGYDAETQFAQLVEEDTHQQYYLFQRFKMRLWQHDLSRNMTIEDESGKKLPAMTVFYLAIKYLKDDVFENASRSVGGEQKDIQWVLTVPAIWKDNAKQFMREATVKAGIPSENLLIALESEAASLYCRYLSLDKPEHETAFRQFSAGTRYMVVDAGGGTVDVTVHEVTENESLKAIDKASGGAWGGTKVDDAFLECLTKVTGTKVFEQFKQKHVDDYVDLLREFEWQKRGISPEKDNPISIRIPVVLNELLKDQGTTLTDAIKNSAYNNELKVFKDKLKIDASLAKRCFDGPIDGIVKHIAELLRDPVNARITVILMVGGFSETPLLHNTIRMKYPGLKVIIPDEPGLAVLKGAVIFGHRPLSIDMRISTYTYGVQMRLPASKDKYQTTGSVSEDDDSHWCTDRFSKFIEAGQKLAVGECSKEENFYPARADSKYMSINVYASNKKNPRSVTEDGCVQIGALKVPLEGRGDKRAVSIRMVFGGTEIDVECMELATEKLSHLKVDFLK